MATAISLCLFVAPGFAAPEVWTTMKRVPPTLIDAKAVSVRCQWVGPGGDSLGIGHGSVRLTDSRGGTVSRITLADARACVSN